MPSKFKIIFTISASAFFVAALLISPGTVLRGFAVIRSVFAAPTCDPSGTCSVLTTDGSGNFGIGANSDAASRLFIKDADTSSTKFGLKIVSSDGSTPVFVVRNDGAISLASSTYVGGRLCFGTMGTGTDCVTSWSGVGGGVTSTPAGYVTPGYFNSVAGTGGNYSFPASLSIGTSTAPSGGVLFVSGNVGIGTRTPSSLLSVAGSAKTDGTTILADAFRFYTGQLDGSAAYTDLRTNPTTGNAILSAKTASIFFNYDHGNAGTFWSNGNEQSYAYMSATGQLTLGNNGVLGNTTIPSVRNTLDVNGGAVIGDAYANVNTAPANGLIVQGLVGIATTTPTYLLTIGNGGIGMDNNTHLAARTSTGSYEMWMLPRGSDNVMYTNFAQNGWNIRNRTSGSVMFLTNGGNVGIATTTPTYPLTVAGVIHSSTGGYRFPDGTTQTTAASGSGANYFTLSGTNLYPTSTAYRLGIGTATPNPSYRISTFDGGIYVGSGNQDGTPVAYFNSSNSGVAVYIDSMYSDGGYLGGTGMTSNTEFGLFGANDEVIAVFDQQGQKFHYGGSSVVTEYGTGGKVGIGTVSPAYLLDVNNGANTTYPLQLTSAGKYVRIGALNSSYAHVDTDATGGFYFYDQVSIGAGNNFLNLSSGNSYLASAGGNVGIATTTPAYKLSVAGVIHSSTGGYRFPDGTTQTTAASAGVSLAGTNTWTGTNYFRSAPGSGATILTSNAWNLQSFSTDGGGAAMSFHRSGAYAVNMGLNPDNSFAIGGWSDGAVNRISIAANGNTTFGNTGTAKINVGTIDPPYTINGEQYATYLPGMIGQKEETTGELSLICHSGLDPESSATCQTTIDFNTQEKGSDLWLFAKTTNLKNSFDKMTVLLTPSFDGRVWYEKDTKNNTLKIFASPVISDKSLVDSYSVSYRLTAPRFDSANWLNTRNDAGVTGFIIND